MDIILFKADDKIFHRVKQVIKRFTSYQEISLCPHIVTMAPELVPTLINRHIGSPTFGESIQQETEQTKEINNAWSNRKPEETLSFKKKVDFLRNLKQIAF